ncbi:MAG: SEC-C metal-binding domain-containing protein, partial [Ilumatobacteraceae bacterium]
FGSRMKGIAKDFVRYVMPIRVVQNALSLAAPGSDVQQSSADDEQPSGFQAAAASAVATGEVPAGAPAPSATAIPEASRGGGTRAVTRQSAARPAKQETVVKDEWSKTPRNAPCPCGSGKKFKMCHGAS